MTPDISKQPTESFTIEDENHAVAFLRERWLIDQFMKTPDLSKPWFSAVADKSHETHFIVGGKFSGFDNPDDNGHVVYCLPKALLTEQQFVDWLQQFIHANDPSGLETSLKPRNPYN
ncbi:MAG: hypothetical protein ABGZ35_24265 [Planctomycetaceae bacterium]